MSNININGVHYAFEEVCVPLETNSADVAEFFKVHWVQKHMAEPAQRLYRLTQEDGFGNVRSIRVVRNEMREIVAMSLRDNHDVTNYGLGTVIVRERDRRKGIGNFLVKEQIAQLLQEHEDQQIFGVTTETLQGLHLVLALSLDELKGKQLDILIEDSVLTEIIDEIFDRFADQIKNSMFSSIQDLFDEQQLSVHLSDEIMPNNQSIRERLFYIFKSLSTHDLVQLWKLTDTVALRQQLSKIGIIIEPAS